jgi:competence protein ComEA
VSALRPAFALSVAAAMLFSSIALASSVQQSTPKETPSKMPDDPDTPLFVTLCHDCHDATNIVSRRRTMAEWEEIIIKMIEKGLKAEDKDLETVFAYVSRHYGKVFINRAPADELIAVLTIPQKDADAIVSYRKAGGAFTDFDSLKKVPGLDVKRLEDNRDAIAY